MRIFITTYVCLFAWALTAIGGDTDLRWETVKESASKSLIGGVEGDAIEVIGVLGYTRTKTRDSCIWLIREGDKPIYCLLALIAKWPEELEGNLIAVKGTLKVIDRNFPAGVQHAGSGPRLFLTEIQTLSGYSINNQANKESNKSAFGFPDKAREQKKE